MAKHCEASGGERIESLRSTLMMGVGQWILRFGKERVKFVSMLQEQDAIEKYCAANSLRFVRVIVRDELPYEVSQWCDLGFLYPVEVAKL